MFQNKYVHSQRLHIEFQKLAFVQSKKTSSSMYSYNRLFIHIVKINKYNKKRGRGVHAFALILKNNNNLQFLKVLLCLSQRLPHLQL